VRLTNNEERTDINSEASKKFDWDKMAQDVQEIVE